MTLYYKTIKTEGNKFIASSDANGFVFENSGFTVNPKIVMWNPLTNPNSFTIIRNVSLYLLDGTPLQNIVQIGMGYQITEPSNGTTLANILSVDGAIPSTSIKIDSTVDNPPTFVKPLIGISTTGLYEMQRGLDESFILSPGYFFSLHLQKPMPLVTFVCSVSFEETEVAI